MRFKGRGIVCEQLSFQTPIKPLIIYGTETESDRFAFLYSHIVRQWGFRKIGSLLLSGSKRRKLQFAGLINFKIVMLFTDPGGSKKQISQQKKKLIRIWLVASDTIVII